MEADPPTKRSSSPTTTTEKGVTSIFVDVLPRGCSNDSDCDDNNECTSDSCELGKCYFENACIGTECNPMMCEDNQCVPSTGCLVVLYF